MEIINDDRPNTNWVTARVCGRWCQAKLFDIGSGYGINGGRISKLSVAKEGIDFLGVESGLPYLDNLDYNYDRGLDFDELENGLLEKIVSKFEALPKAFS
jgi:hypothetical protein